MLSPKFLQLILTDGSGAISATKNINIIFCTKSTKNGCHAQTAGLCIRTEWKTCEFWKKKKKKNFRRTWIHWWQELSAATERGKLQSAEHWGPTQIIMQSPLSAQEWVLYGGQIETLQNQYYGSIRGRAWRSAKNPLLVRKQCTLWILYLAVVHYTAFTLINKKREGWYGVGVRGVGGLCTWASNVKHSALWL